MVGLCSSNAPARRLRTAAAAGLAALVCLLVAGCGGEEPKQTREIVAGNDATSSASETSTVESLPDWPDCSEVWVADAAFPAKYRGCLADGVAVRADTVTCSSGQALVTYDDRFYAVKGEHVNETQGLGRDRAYRRAMNACIA